MTNVFSKFSDESTTWTNGGLFVLFHPYVSDGLSTNRGALVRISFSYGPSLLCVSMDILGFPLLPHLQSRILLPWAASVALFEHLKRVPERCRLLGQWSEASKYCCARKLRMKAAVFPLPFPLTTSRHCPGPRICHSAVERWQHFTSWTSLETLCDVKLMCSECSEGMKRDKC